MGVRSWLLPDPQFIDRTERHEGRLYMIDSDLVTIHLTCINGVWRAFVYPETDVIGVGDTADFAIADLQIRLGRGIFTPVT